MKSAERLDGNIGYLRIDRFAPAREAGPVLQAAIAMLSATGALIIGLRHALAAARRDAARLLIANHPDDPITSELQALLKP